jgi:hypothetical protein
MLAEGVSESCLVCVLYKYKTLNIKACIQVSKSVCHTYYNIRHSQVNLQLISSINTAAIQMNWLMRRISLLHTANFTN